MPGHTKINEDLFEAVFDHSNLSRRQLLIWAGHQKQVRLPVYSIPFLWTFPGRLDWENLQSAFQMVVHSHEALRTVFKVESGTPQSMVVDQMPVDMAWVDLSNEIHEQKALDEWIEARIQFKFAFDQCLFDTAYIKLGDRCAWYLNEHHLITDGRSKELVFRKTAEAYRRLTDKTSAAKADSVPYSEFIAHERKSLKKRNAERAQHYWTDFLNNHPSCEVFSNPTHFSTRGIRILHALESSLMDRILAIGDTREGNLTLVSVMITTLLALLNRWTGRKQLTIAHTLSNRPAPRHQDIIGLCLEVAPLAVTVDTGDTFHSLRRKVMKGVIEGMRFINHIPWNRSGPRIFDVSFNLLNPRFSGFEPLHPHTQWLFPGHQETALNLQVLDFEDALPKQLAFDFREDAMPASDRKVFVSEFLRFLRFGLDHYEAEIKSMDCELTTMNPMAKPEGRNPPLESPISNPGKQPESPSDNLTELESKMADIWKELFGIPRVGWQDNFFDLGGDSIVAIHLLGEIRQQISVSLKPRTIFDHPVLRELCCEIEKTLP